MDTRSAKRFNQAAGFRPDPAIAFFDALAANSAETKIMKLPKVPNTKGKYLAQYVDITGVARIYKWNGTQDHFVIYRVLPDGIVRYFLEADTEDFKNTNSRNHYITGDLGNVYKNILNYRMNLSYKFVGEVKDIVSLMKFQMNLDRLIERKKDTTLLLRQVASVITKKTVVEFDDKTWSLQSGHGSHLIKAQYALDSLRKALSELDEMGIIKYQK